MEIKGQQRPLELPQFVRLAPENVVPELGPLAGLVGTWTGQQGWNLIAVPEPGHVHGFTLLIRPYYETITFTPLGVLVPNRGASEILNIYGVEYSLRVSDAETNEALHLENGMWLYTNDPQSPQSPTIVRQAAVPHGNSVLALGTFTQFDGPPTNIPAVEVFPIGQPPGAPPGYSDPYQHGGLPPAFVNGDPNAVLREAIKDQNILNTLVLDVSTHAGGGIVNIPFIVKNANATSFKATFWLETVKDPNTGVEFNQLQYSQQTNLDFMECGVGCSHHSKGLIVWPHVNVNTLVRQ